jgi:hypothetical protein
LEATAKNLNDTLSGSPEDYGYGSWLEMAEALTEAAENTEEAWNNIEIPEELKDTDGLTLKGAQAIEDDVEHIKSGSQGEAGVETYTEGITKLTEAMGEAEKSEFMNRIGDVDWSSWYAMEDVTAILKDMDVALNMTDEELQ